MAWCDIGNIDQALRRRYIGRKQGLVLKEVPVAHLMNTTFKPTLTPVALAWKTLRIETLQLLRQRRKFDLGNLSLGKLHDAAIRMTAVDVTAIAADIGQEVNVGKLINTSMLRSHFGSSLNSL